MSSDGTPWVEKYRPTNLSAVVLEPSNRTLFTNVLEKQRFPNMLFYGPPGTGKTTTIINLVHEYNERHHPNGKKLVMHLNASDDRGIEVMRTQIMQFVSTSPVLGEGLKFVVLDEVDSMTKNAQVALRHILSEYSTSVRFCLICNFISRIDIALQHMLVLVRFQNVPASSVHSFLASIASAEGLEIQDAGLRAIMKAYDSDLRSMVNALQLSAETGSGFDAVSTSDVEMLYSTIKDTNVDIPTVLRSLRQQCERRNCHARDVLSTLLEWIVSTKHDRIWSDTNLLTKFVRAAHPSIQDSPFFARATVVWLRESQL